MMKLSSDADISPLGDVVRFKQNSIGVIRAAGSCKISGKQYREVGRQLGNSFTTINDIISRFGAASSADEVLILKNVTGTLAKPASKVTLVDIKAVAAADCDLPPSLSRLAARLLARKGADCQIPTTAFFVSPPLEGSGESSESDDDDEEDDGDGSCGEEAEDVDAGGSVAPAAAAPPPWAASNGGEVPAGALREHIRGMEPWLIAKVHLGRTSAKPLADSTWDNTRRALLRFLVHGGGNGWRTKGLFVCFEPELVVAHIRYMLFDKRNSVASAFLATNALSKVLSSLTTPTFSERSTRISESLLIFFLAFRHRTTAQPSF